MTSGAWGSGEQTPGDGSTSGRGTSGEAAPTPIGGTRVVIATGAMLLTLLCVGLAIEVGVRNGLLILAIIFAVVYAWAIGAFSPGFWSR